MIVDGSDLAVAWRRLTRQRRKIKDDQEGAIIGFGDEGRVVRWPPVRAERASHVSIFAGSGSGKTVLTANALALEIVSQRQLPPIERPALLVIDCKGDLETHLLEALAATCPEALRDVHYLDPYDGLGFPFNLRLLKLGKTPIEVRALQLAGMVGGVSTAIGEQKHLGTGQRQVDVLLKLHLAVLTSTHPEANLMWAQDALMIKQGTQRLASVTGSRDARQFLLDATLSEELRASCASRIGAVYGLTEATQARYCAPSCIQFDEILGSGAIVILALGRPTAGLSFLQKFDGDSFSRFAFDYLFERVSPWKGHHVRIVIDEAQVVADVLAKSAEAIYTQGRSRGISLTTITQGTVLLRDASNTLLQVMLSNCPTKIIGRLNSPDAQLLAREQGTRHGIDERLSEVHSKFIASVTNLPDRDFLRVLPGETIRFTSSKVDMEAWTRAADARGDEIAALKSRMSLTTAAPRKTLGDAVPLLERPRRGRPRARKAAAAPTAPAAATPAPEREAKRVPSGSGSTRWG